jgi:SAM-dependent methyltransferase
VFYRFYDALFARKDYAGEVQRVLALGGVTRPARLLEIGAGTGSHTIACAELGHAVAAVEIDPQMVAIAQPRFAALPPALQARICLHAAPVEQLDARDFDIALAMFNVVNYIPRIADLQSFVNGVTQRLKPGAPFMFDAWNGVAALLDPPRGKETTTETPTHSVHVQLTSQLHAMALTTQLDYALTARDRRTGAEERGHYTLTQVLWPAKVLRDVAEAAGLTVVGVHPLDTTARPATEQDWKILFHTRRA